MFKQIGRVALAVLVTLALGLGLTAFAGAANATGSASSCSAQHSAVVKAKKHVKKDKRKLHAAKRHHNKAGVRKAKRHLARDRARLSAARNAYSACANGQPAPAPAPAPAPTPAPSNPVTEQCNGYASQITSQDPSGQLGAGSAAFCDLLGQLAGASGGDPTSICYQLAANDPTGQFVQLCDAFAGGLPSGGLPGVPTTGGVPTGGLIGDTLGDLCDQIAANDPSGQLSQLCTGLHSLPI